MLFLALLASPPAPMSVETRKGAVVCDEPLAAQAGAEVLREGGNAVDAAAAVAFTLAVVEPTAGNIGGGGFMLVRMADGRASFLDYRERAPRRASRDMYLDKSGNLIKDASTLGAKAAGVPGTVAGMELAVRRYGRLPWRRVVEPALRLAERGFPLSASQAGALKGDAKRLGRFETTLHTYLRDGRLYAAGETVRLPELAATLRRIRDLGAKDFYRGETARMIAEHMRKHGGLVDEKDLADYRVAARKPLLGTYRGHTLLTAPPPSSGGTALIEMLNVLEGYPMTNDRPQRVHLIVEAMKRAFADRAELMGDPDFARVPVDRLTSKGYADVLRWRIRKDRTTPSGEIRAGEWNDAEHRQTTHFSVVDAAGNAVSNTYTLNGSFGAADTVEGAGFLLNNEMDDFAAKPGSPNMFGLIQGERNAIAPGKRPLSSMTPTIVLKDGKLEMVLGSPGGPTIINTVLEAFLYRVDFGLSPTDAIAAPRFHHQWMPDELVAEGLPSDVVNGLQDRGHLVRLRGRQGIANCIFVDPLTGLRTGVADRRYGDASAVGQ